MCILLSVDIKSLVSSVEFPWSVLLIAPILHERREGTQLSPSNQQLFCSTQCSRPTSVTSNV